MTKDEIKRRYMKTIKPRVDEAMEYAGQPNFDMLYETCLGPSAYSLFFPMSDVDPAGPLRAGAKGSRRLIVALSVTA